MYQLERSLAWTNFLHSLNAILMNLIALFDVDGILKVVFYSAMDLMDERGVF